MRSITSVGSLLIGLLALSCQRSDTQAHPTLGRPAPAQSAKPPLGPAAPAVADTPSDPTQAERWTDALRVGRYAEAAQALDELALDYAEEPELAFARARAALELGDFQRAAELSRGLEVRLPVLERQVRRLRAEAELEVGPYASAAEYFLGRGDSESLAQAALALERGGELERANAIATRVVKELKGRRHRQVESLARDVRARIAERRGQKAQAALDLRWLALENPRWSDDADERLAALGANHALTKEERLARTFSFARAGGLERVEREIRALSTARGAPIAAARIDRVRAFALYFARRDYTKASELFTRAARGPGVDPAECAFYAARSLARAQDDAQAVSGYRNVHERYRGTTWGEHALYLVATTHYAGGRFADAASGYDAYLRAHARRGRFRADALYERAVSWLALGNWAPAARAFSELARAEKNPRRQARLRHLEGVARAGAGETTRAIELFTRVAREQPLGFAALASAARLERLGVAPPPPLPPAQSTTEKPPPLSVELPEAVGLLRRIGLDADAEAELGRFETSLFKRHAPRSNEALCAAYAQLAPAARRYQIAQDRVDGRVLMVSPSSETRWQWDCVYPRPYPRAVNEASKTFGVPEALLYGVMRQESGFRPTVTSHAGANGLMQVILPTAERVAQELGEPFDASLLGAPGPNLRFGAHYLKKLLEAFGGNVALAAGAYNAGPIAMRRWMNGASGLDLDVFVARIPYDETLEYVERVVGNFARYLYLEGGEAAVPRLALELPQAPPDSLELY